MKNGIFISIEGTDGAGKSTQIAEVEKYFVRMGKDVIITREPGGTEIGEKIRSIILDRENAGMEYITELMLYAAARAEHVAKVIKPALEKGKVVICDRYIDSSMAYQGYGRELKEAVSIVNSYAVEHCMPDITFLLKISPDVSLKRINTADQDRIEMEDMRFHEAVFSGYLDIEKNNPKRVIGIDGDQDETAITMEIYSALERITGEGLNAE